MLVSLISDEDFAQSSAALLGDISAMDYIPFFSSANAQAWQTYLTARSIYLQESSSIGGYVETEYVELLSISLAKTIPGAILHSSGRLIESVAGVQPALLLTFRPHHRPHDANGPDDSKWW
jgi:hypothetical protein